MKLLFLLSFFVSSSAVANWHFEQQPIMGTAVKVTLWHTDEDKAKQALAVVFQEMERINQLMSPYIESSELYRINSRAANQPVKISNELYGLIDKAQKISQLTQGAFDITFASVGFLYDYRNRIKPQDNQLSEFVNAINFQDVVLDAKQQTVVFKKAQTKIDLGGIAKGYAVDNAIALLQQLGVSSALVSAGGDTRALGTHSSRPWSVAIQDPRKKERHAMQLPLEDEAISTSGDYERYFIQEGERYHHILDPKTGKSVGAIQSVSIIGKRAVMTDALSTSVFVLGVSKGLELINQLEGYEALVIDNKRKLHFSNGLVAQ